MSPTVAASLALFTIIALGLLLGKVRIRGIALDNAAVIFVGLVFGHFGVVIPEIFQTLGLVFFVFSVGMQSGPGFLEAFGRSGLRLILPAALMIVLSAALALGLAALFHLDLRLTLGLLTGARSSNSALAVAVQSTASNLPALGHSLAYPLGVLAILLLVRLLPTLFRADLRREEEEYRLRLEREHPPLVTRTFRVDNPNAAGRPLAELHVGRLTGVNISRILHDGEILVPGPGVVLNRGDLVKAVGLDADLDHLTLLLGPETKAENFVEMKLDQKHEAQWLTVSNKAVVNQPLHRLGLLEDYGATVTRLQRNGIEISPHGMTVLRFADRIMVVAGKSRFEAVRARVGDANRGIDKDFLPLFLIILIGLALGSVVVPLSPTFPFSLGLTGGVLIASLVLSAVGRTGPVLWAISESSNRFVRTLGLLLFLAAVGTSAGSQMMTALTANGVALVVTALTVCVVPLLVLALVGRLVLRMNLLTLMGLVAGSTTCSPALGVANALTPTNIPNVAYATVFPFSLIFMMVCAQLIAALF